MARNASEPSLASSIHSSTKHPNKMDLSSTRCPHVHSIEPRYVQHVPSTMPTEHRADPGLGHCGNIRTWGPSAQRVWFQPASWCRARLDNFPAPSARSRETIWLANGVVGPDQAGGGSARKRNLDEEHITWRPGTVEQPHMGTACSALPRKRSLYLRSPLCLC
jgi:hypothetical protein